MNITKAIITLSKVGRDIKQGLLLHHGDISTTDYTAGMIDEPIRKVREFLDIGDEKNAAATIRKYAEHISADLQNEVIVSDSPEFSTTEYNRKVLFPLIWDLGGNPGTGDKDRNRTSEEIVQEANDLAREFYKVQGYVVPEGYRFDKAIHPHEINCWQMAIIAFERLQATSVEDALAEIEY